MAGCPLHRAEVFFQRDEDLVLALYARLAAELESRVQDLPEGDIATRFRAVMLTKLSLVAPYREALAALLATLLDPRHELGALSPNTEVIRGRVMGVFAEVVLGASNGKKTEAQTRARSLYGAHLALMLLWTQDQTYLLYMLRIRRVEFGIAEIPILAIPVLLLVRDTSALGTYAFWEGILILFLLFAFGDMINCLADRDLDAIYKRHLSGAVYGLGVRFVTFQVVATAVIALGLSIHLSWRMDRWILSALVAIGLTLGTAYSVKPIQLRGRGLAQLVCCAHYLRWANDLCELARQRVFIADRRHPGRHVWDDPDGGHSREHG